MSQKWNKGKWSKKGVFSNIWMELTAAKKKNFWEEQMKRSMCEIRNSGVRALGS